MCLQLDQHCQDTLILSTPQKPWAVWYNRDNVPTCTYLVWYHKSVFICNLIFLSSLFFVSLLVSSFCKYNGSDHSVITRQSSFFYFLHLKLCKFNDVIIAFLSHIFLSVPSVLNIIISCVYFRTICDTQSLWITFIIHKIYFW